MKYAVLITGVIGALLFLFSIYIFWVHPEQFKIVAYGFLGFAVVFFILVIIKKVREDKEKRNKIRR